MKRISRRKALQLFSSAPVAAAALVWTSSETEAAQTQAQAARRQATERGAAFQPKFFTRREYATVNVLADLIIPRDERSGSAGDAGVPEFMDFMMIDQPLRQTAMRGGLAFIDHLCDARFDKPFVECTDGERRQVLQTRLWMRAITNRKTAHAGIAGELEVMLDRAGFVEVAPIPPPPGAPFSVIVARKPA